MSEYTPGPWALWTSNSWRRFGSDTHGIVLQPVVSRADGQPDLLVRDADARLIAAAPELYEALELAVRELHENNGEAVCDHDAGICWCSYWSAIRAAESALAKARGEQ